MAEKRKASPHPKEGTAEKKSANDFPIVGIGGSAGGLEAFAAFFSVMPADSGIAFVVIPHLDPGHKSMMTDLLGRHTRMKVEEAEDGVMVTPNHVYIIPPNKDMAIYHGALHLTTFLEPRGLRMPIDFFCRSLAEDRGENAICIILSGTGTDGSLGISAVHGAGGMSMAQDPTEAKYDGMPRSAIETGFVDYVIPVEKMPSQLIAYMKQSLPQRARRILSMREKGTASLQKIFMTLRTKTGHDFSGYKPSTMHRRIERRMSLHEITNIDDYARYLQTNTEEARVLLKELLIGVTSFFREPEAFEALKQTLLELLGKKSDGYQVRVWVPGCASGEEAYSLAITLSECIDELGKDLKVQIFGTDIDEEAINRARAGFYPDNISLDISAERLQRFFVKERGGLRIKKTVREMVIFAVQNLIKDPPFTKLDLISCRNLMIYLSSNLQGRIFPLFAYSLKPKGFLFLGSSESIGGFSDLFSTADKKWKIYERKETDLAPQAVAFTGLPWAHEAGTGYIPRTGGTQRGTIAGAAEKMILESVTPPCVVANDRGDIVYIHGRTGKYLEPAQGEPGMNIFTMAREGLRPELNAGFMSASKGKAVSYRGLKVKQNGHFQLVNMTVSPVHDPEIMQGLTLVVFEDGKETRRRHTAKGEETPGASHQGFEQELEHTRETLRATVEEMQATNEELKSSNEELQSTNEELQSTNEELETSKEELQSVNEELITVNGELESKIEDLSRAENDMKNLLDSTHMGTIFLDNSLRVKRFTSDATRVVNLIEADIGRPIGHIVTNLDYEDLLKDAQMVLDTFIYEEKEVHTKDGAWFLMRILPYRTVEKTIEGVVITFTEIDKLKKAAHELEEAHAENVALEAARGLADAIVDTVKEPLIVLGEELNVVTANRSFLSMFQTTAEEIKEKSVFDIGTGQWDVPRLKKLLQNLLPTDTRIEGFEVAYKFPDHTRKELLLDARRIVQKGFHSPMILVAIREKG